MPEQSHTVSAIIVNFNGGPALIACLRALVDQSSRVDELIVVDNASHDGSLDTALNEFPELHWIRNTLNRGFAAAANQGATVAHGSVLVFLNPDVECSRTCIDYLVKQLRRYPGATGPYIELEADHNEPSGGTIDRLGYPSRAAYGAPLYVSGSALATNRSAFDLVGGFDERYFMFVEDVDYCWRVLAAGCHVTVCQEAIASHRGGAVAKGGYVRQGRLDTTTLRFGLRERNSLAMLLKCAPMGWLAWILPFQACKITLLACVALVLRKPMLAASLISGLFWNAWQTPTTLRLRWSSAKSPSGQRIAASRIYRGWFAVEHIRAFGLPRFVDH